MSAAQKTVTVPSPIQTLFAIMADGLNGPKWRPDVMAVRHISGDGVGIVWAQTRRGPGSVKIRGDYRITGFDSPTALGFEVIAGPARPTGVFRLRQFSPRSTELIFSLNLIPTRFMRVMAPMIAKQMVHEVEAVSGVAPAMAVGVSAFKPSE